MIFGGVIPSKRKYGENQSALFSFLRMIPTSEYPAGIFGDVKMTTRDKARILLPLARIAWQQGHALSGYYTILKYIEAGKFSALRSWGVNAEKVIDYCEKQLRVKL